jgi:hypothetical protein
MLLVLYLGKLEILIEMGRLQHYLQAQTIVHQLFWMYFSVPLSNMDLHPECGVIGVVKTRLFVFICLWNEGSTEDLLSGARMSPTLAISSNLFIF